MWALLFAVESLLVVILAGSPRGDNGWHDHDSDEAKRGEEVMHGVPWAGECVARRESTAGS